MTGDDDIIITNQDRINESKLSDGSGDLRDLGFRMCAGVARIGDQPIHRHGFDFKVHFVNQMKLGEQLDVLDRLTLQSRRNSGLPFGLSSCRQVSFWLCR